MKTIKRIMVAIDFSSYSEQLLQYAAGIAARHGAEIIAVSVINKHFIDAVENVCSEDHPGSFSIQKFLREETRRRKDTLKSMVAQWVERQLTARVVIGSGIPFVEILRIVDLEKADLLIIAPKGRTDLPQYLLGSTSEKLFRHAPVSILSLAGR